MISQRALFCTTALLACLGGRAVAQYNPYSYGNPYGYVAPYGYASPYGMYPQHVAYPPMFHGYQPPFPPAHARPFHPAPAGWPPPPPLPVPPTPAATWPPKAPQPPLPPWLQMRVPEGVEPVKHVGVPVSPAIETAPTGPKDTSDVIPAQAPVPEIPGTVSGLIPATPVSPPSFWTFGSGAYFIQPVFESNPAYRLHRRIGPDSLENTYQNFRHDVGTAPLAWIGYMGGTGFGMRGRWFNFSQDAYESIVKDDSFIRAFHAKPLDLGVDFGTKRGSFFEFNSNLTVNVADLEVTRLLDGPNWSLLIAAGVRYAHMSQDYRAFGPRSETDLLISSGHNFNGIGPTLALEGKRGLFDTRFSFYTNARFSILFGTAKQTAHELVTDRDTGVLVHSTFNFAQQADVLPIGDLELGLEYGRNFGGFGLFVQLGFMGQVWIGGGNAANTTVTGEVAQNTGNFGFLGGAFRFGFDF